MSQAYNTLKNDKNDGEAYTALKKELNVQYDISTTNLLRLYQQHEREAHERDFLMLTLNKDNQEHYDRVFKDSNMSEYLFYNKLNL